MIKERICYILGIIGGTIASLLGGWSEGVEALCILMATDIILGCIVAAVYKRSKKTEGGALSSWALWKGLLKKALTLVIVGVGAQVDKTIGTHFLRDGFVVAFSVGEGLSIIENAGLMGLPIPKPIKAALESLNEKKIKTSE